MTNPTQGRRGIFLAGGALGLAGAAAYANSLSGPFAFDDPGSIIGNTTIRHWWRIGTVLMPPAAGGETVGGRPILNLSLAFNYAISGTDVWSYHVLNALIHILAGLVLFGIVRRTFLRWSALPPTRWPTDGAVQRVGVNALHPTAFAFAVALLWTVHPLQTEAVTYTIQRAESLMGLFYLLTLYCFIRGVAPGGPAFAPRGGARAGKKPPRGAAFWFGLSWLACLFGMATKEVMATAPVLVLLYDRTFVAGSFRGALRERGKYYGLIASAWLLLAGLMASTHNRGGSIGYGNGVAWWAYALTQFTAVAHYLRLSLWPRPLVFDYGAFWIHGAAEVAPSAAIVLAALALTGWALWRRPILGFLGAWFFVILAPTSSVVPGTTQMIVEHRMYLSLAAVMVLLVLGLHALFRRLAPRSAAAATLWAACVPLAAAGLALTVRRNEIYRNPLTLWRDTVAKRPAAARPRYLLGAAEVSQGDLAGGLADLQRSVRLDPDYPQPHSALGAVYLKMGHRDDAIRQCELAVQEAPGYAQAQYNFGLALLAADRPEEAITHEEIALHQQPDYPEALNTLGNALFRLGQLPAAVHAYESAVGFDPDNVEARHNLGVALANIGNLPEAVAQLREAVRLRPGDPALRNTLERVQAVLERGGP